MAFLTVQELKTHLYDGVVLEIDRTDSGIAQSAIDAAIAEATGYLTAYDSAAIFAAVGNDRNPIILLYVKDIAVWHFIQLANPNVEMNLRLTRYEKAIDFLGRVQSGKVNPSLPYPAAPPPEEFNNYIKYGSNDKRILNF